MRFNQSFFKDNLKKSAITGAILGAAGFGATLYLVPAQIAPLATTIASYMPAALGLAASMASGFALTALAAIAAAVIAAIAILAILAFFQKAPKSADAGPASEVEPEVLCSSSCQVGSSLAN